MTRTQRPRFEAREIDPEGAERALANASEMGVSLDRADVRDLIARTGAAAPAVLTPLLITPGLPDLLADEIVSLGSIVSAALPAPITDLDETFEVTKRRLRKMKREALVRTALRELYAHADVDRTAREWSEVASACCAHALVAAEVHAEARNGAALDENERRVPFVVLGMGKLGGHELNLGSDIDICFFYGTDDGHAGDRTLNEHFGRVGTAMTELLGEATEDGFAFRVDLRLRPEGTRGPVANSLASAERYYETWGRSWERAALLRARPIAGNAEFGAILTDSLKPFVFRRTVDPRIAHEISGMLKRARQEQLEHAQWDLKLGLGAIREAEFFVQSLQLIWGGRHRSLQVTNTLDAVARLRALGLMSHREVRAFGDAWALLRRVEHRVQVMSTHETHVLPSQPGRQRSLARSLSYPHFEALVAALDRARNTVHLLYETLFPKESPSGEKSPSSPPVSAESVLADLVASSASRETIARQAIDALGVKDGDGAVESLLRLARRADMPLGTVARDRYPRIGPQLLAEVRDAPDPDRALEYLADFFGKIHAAERYVHRLADAPDQARGLVGLFGASETLSQTLLARPDLVDAVVSGGAGAPSSDEINERVSTSIALARSDQNEASEESPFERAVGALRRIHREIVLQIGLADMAGVLTAGDVARRLSSLANAQVSEAFALAAEETAARFRIRSDPTERLKDVAVFAMGSLAARELGYGGDIDLIVLFGGAHAGADDTSVSMQEYAARVTQRAIFFLSSPHHEGPGYPVDTRLRPSGAQGTLVVSLEAFRKYHTRQSDSSSSGGAAWERQALIRSRFVAGDEALGAIATQAIEQIAYAQGGVDTAEVARLRERMERELGREHNGEIEIKHGRGGLVDVEFTVQVLQMLHGSDHDVRSPETRRAIAALRDHGHLDPRRADILLSGEKLLRRALLAARLVSGKSTLVPGTAAALTVARKLGYRDRGERGAEEGLLSDLAFERDRIRTVFSEIVS